jgi:photosystem II stability/assembly factor-like uncharacterized protein
MVKRIAGNVFVLCSLLPAMALAAWNAHGPSGGFAYAVVGSGDTLLIGTDDGVYRSTDAGATWQHFGDLPRGITVSSLAVSPADPNVMLAGGASYRTSDGGAHWTPLDTSFDHAAFSPLDPQYVVAVSGFYDANHVLLCSSDGGVTFQSVWIDAMAAVADFASTAFIAVDANGAIYKSPNAKYPCIPPWPKVGQAQAIMTPYAMLQDPLNSNMLFISTDGLDATYFVRYDLASDTTTWISSNGGSAFADPVQTGRLWLSGLDYSNGGYALSESLDGGMTWLAVMSDIPGVAIGADPTILDTLYGNDGVGFTVSRDAGLTWESRTEGVPLVQTSAVSIRTDAPGEVLAATANGVAISTDGGLTWSPSDTSPTESVNSFARSPADATLVYGGTRFGIFRSTDAGRNWQQVTPPDEHSGYDSIEFDRMNPTRMSAIQDYHVAWSEDAGSSWTAATIQGAGSADFRQLAHSPRGTGIVYALAFLHNDVFALYRASAHGQPLVAIAPDLPLNALAVNPSNDRMLFAIAHDESYQMSTTYLSVDAGDHWQARSTFAYPMFGLLSFDPCDGRTVCVQGINVLHISHDLGLTWSTEQAELPVGIVDDIDMSCTAGTLSMAVATFQRGAEVRDPEFVDVVLGDGFDGD